MFDRDENSENAECILGVIEAVARFVASLDHEQVSSFY